MEKQIIETPIQWLNAINTRLATPAEMQKKLYVKEDLIKDFNMWSIKHAMIDGFKYGVGAGLALAVTIAAIVKLMGM